MQLLRRARVPLIERERAGESPRQPANFNFSGRARPRRPRSGCVLLGALNLMYVELELPVQAKPKASNVVHVAVHFLATLCNQARLLRHQTRTLRGPKIKAFELIRSSGRKHNVWAIRSDVNLDQICVSDAFLRTLRVFACVL
jgi:hypothetical protein